MVSFTHYWLTLKGNKTTQSPDDKLYVEVSIFFGGGGGVMACSGIRLAYNTEQIITRGTAVFTFLVRELSHCFARRLRLLQAPNNQDPVLCHIGSFNCL
jgi:hypothetical protein